MNQWAATQTNIGYCSQVFKTLKFSGPELVFMTKEEFINCCTTDPKLGKGMDSGGIVCHVLTSNSHWYIPTLTCRSLTRKSSSSSMELFAGGRLATAGDGFSRRPSTAYGVYRFWFANNNTSLHFRRQMLTNKFQFDHKKGTVVKINKLIKDKKQHV